MSNKSVRDMGKMERMRHSLSARTFHAVVIMALLVSISAIAFGYYLYNTSVNTNCRENAWHASRTITSVLDKKDFVKYCSVIIDVYEKADEKLGIQEKESAYCSSYEPYFKKFSNDTILKSFQTTFDKISTDLEMSSLYYGFIDIKYNRLVYIMDSDNSKSKCPMGFWEKLDNKEADIYLNGDEMSFLEKKLDGHKIPAYVYSSERYGYVCTAGSLISDEGRYKLMAFADYDMNKFTALSRRFLIQYVLLMLFITVIIAFIASAYFKRTIVNPINVLAEAADSYTEFKRNDLDHELSDVDQSSDDEPKAAKRHFDDLDIHTGDEIENLSLTMKDMETDLNSYLDDLKNETAEKQRIRTELSVANSIQEGMLPTKFPPFPDRSEVDIFASMDPAKEVGGDFYDFFFVDDDHICFVIADVSGKGVPAALFMMASKIMIKNVAKMNSHSPAQILEVVNKGMCSNNSLDMFTTAWMGILELSTGRLKAASAGHEYPILRRSGGKFELFNDDAHGFVLGGFMDTEYEDYEIQLNTGDCIFQYTDGVTESDNISRQMFGTDRLIDCLNSMAEDAVSNNGSEATNVIMNVKDSLCKYTQGAEQFDDITMLCIRYTGKGAPVSDDTNNSKHSKSDNDELLPHITDTDGNHLKKDFHTIESSISTDANRDNLFALINFIKQHLKAIHCPLKVQKQVLIAAEEIYVNVASYAYAPGIGTVDIQIQVYDDPGKIVIQFTDSGVPYNPLAKPDPDTTLSAEERSIGGLGIFIVKQTMDDISYRYEDGKNILTIEKLY